MRAIIVVWAPAALALCLVASSGCILPSISPKETDAGSAASASADAGAAPAVQGASCTKLTASVALCQYISACPTLVLNPQVFPQCGFRIHGAAIDPECLCQNRYLCPIGVPTTCAQAAQEASGDRNYDSVCQQALQGGCQDLTGGGSSGGSTTTACQTCVTNCDNVPSCIDACRC